MILVPGAGQPSSHVLANDRTPTGDCLVIFAGTDFVNINLADFSISDSEAGRR